MSELTPLIRASIRRLLGDRVTRSALDAAEEGHWGGELWAQCEAQGMDRVLLPGAEGGAEGDMADARAVIRACGEHVLPLPVPESLLGRWCLLRAGLPQPDGIVTLSPSAPHLEADGRLQGTLERVPWGRSADGVVAAVAGRPGYIVLLPGRALVWTTGRNLAGEPRDTARVDGAEYQGGVLNLGGDTPAPGDTLAHIGALMRATQIAGAAEAAVSRAVEHATSRSQFGRPLAKFQVIQHNLASAAAAVAATDAVTMAAWRALQVIPSGRHRSRDARLLMAAAKVSAGETVALAAAIAHQVHGAMGFTHEHILHHLTRRQWAWRTEFGGADDWSRRLGRLAIRRGGAGLWADLTSVTDR